MEDQSNLVSQRLLLHLTNSPLAAIEWNTDLLITAWSEQAVKIFGWESNEAVGKTIEQLNLVYAEDGQVVSSVINNLLSGFPDRSKLINRNNTKSGSVIYCEWYNSVLKDDSGRTVSCMSLVQDITEKKRAEDVIAFNERQLDLIYNSSSDVLFLLAVEQNEKFRFVSINNAFRKATGLESNQIINKYVEEVIPQPSAQLVVQKYKHAIEIRNTVSWEEVLSFKSLVISIRT